MGQALVRLATEWPEYKLVAQIDAGENIPAAVEAADVVIDFSHHSVTLEVVQEAAQEGKALVIGTTGHSDADRESILHHGTMIPLIMAPNFSVGVNTLFYLTRKAAEILGEGFDQEVVEMHHRMKKDSPSGTARRLVEILCDVKEKDYNELVRNGREGEPGERTSDEIGVHAIRGGDVVGDHTVIFATQGERLELTHKASSRDTFASGALRAARWLQGREPGVYRMLDVLGLK